MKPLKFIDSSHKDLNKMPIDVRHAVGVELMRVQFGARPQDFKPMTSVGSGAYEVRVRDAEGAFRVIYVAKFTDAVYVLHAFQKKSRKTAKADIDLATRRYRKLADALK